MDNHGCSFARCYLHFISLRIPIIIKAMDNVSQHQLTEMIQEIRDILRRSTVVVDDSKNTYLSKAEACKRLGVSLGTLDNKTRAGTIKSKKLGRRVLYKPEWLEAALNQ